MLYTKILKKQNSRCWQRCGYWWPTIPGVALGGLAVGGLDILGLAGVAAGGVPGDGIAAGGGGPPAANTDSVKIFVADAAAIANKVNFIRITY